MLPLVYNDEVMFPVCAGIETRKLESSNPEHGMFPVCAGIEIYKTSCSRLRSDVSRVCGN